MLSLQRLHKVEYFRLAFDVIYTLVGYFRMILYRADILPEIVIKTRLKLCKHIRIQMGQNKSHNAFLPKVSIPQTEIGFHVKICVSLR